MSNELKKLAAECLDYNISGFKTKTDLEARYFLQRLCGEVPQLAHTLLAAMEVVEAAKERACSGHNDVCHSMLKFRDCSCGHVDLENALARWEQAGGEGQSE